MVITSLDFDKPGKQQGFLQVPYSHNLGGWANVMIPITIVARGKGPTVLVLGGNHGDEYQGQIAAMKLARELTAGNGDGAHHPHSVAELPCRARRHAPLAARWHEHEPRLSR